MGPVRGVRIAAGVLGTALAASCTGSGGSADGPIELTFWAWAPEIEDVVELWNEENPDVQVTVSNQGAGEEVVTLLLTASRAGNPPDLVQAEYQALTTLVANDAVADIAEHSAGLADEFGEGLWEQVTLGTEAVYGIPQDSGPMMLYYRSDLFEEFGLDVPATWDEFADTGAEIREEHPGHYLTTFSAADPGWFTGLSQQAGASWWEVEGDTWQVTVDDEATMRVAEYWDELVSEDIVHDQPMYTPEWNAALNDGTLLAWPGAVWAPGVLAGNAEDTAGDWSMAPLPQWEEGRTTTGNWGGSATSVTTGTEHTEAAAEFAAWLNGSPEATEALVTESGLYPAATDAQAGPALADPPEFFAHQEDFYEEAAEIAEDVAGFTWGPNVNVTYGTYEDAFSAAINDGTPFTDAVEQMHLDTLADMESKGFTLAE